MKKLISFLLKIVAVVVFDFVFVEKLVVIDVVDDHHHRRHFHHLQCYLQHRLHPPQPFESLLTFLLSYFEGWVSCLLLLLEVGL
jgi:hypothetical protein